MKKILTLFLILITNPIFSQNEQSIIADIQFQGLKATSQNDVLSTIQIRKGEFYSPEKLNFALQNLFSMQRFKDIKADVKNSASGVIITFFIEEESLVDRIVFNGVSRLKASKLKDTIDFKEGTAFTDAKVKASLYQMQQYFKNEGFLDAKLDFRLEPIKQLPGQFDLHFDISEGPKIVVLQINFTGLSAFKPRTLEGKMKVKKKMWIFRSGVLKEEEFLSDKNALIAFYQQNGYMDVEIKKYEWKITDVNTTNKAGEITKSVRGIAIDIEISEGEPYTVGNFSFEGNQIFNQNDLQSLVTLKENDVYNKTTIEMIRAGIYTMYADRGYLYANISVLEKKKENHIIDVVFVINEGKRAHIENIVVRGNTKTYPSVVKRYVQIKEGELYVSSKLQQSYNLLMQTQFFSEVRINPSQGSADGLVNVDFEVVEDQTGMVELLLGYGTASGFSGGIKLSERNFLGRGWNISVRGEYGEFRQLGEISFTDPAVNNSPFSLSFVFGVFNTIYTDIPTDDNNDGLIDKTDFDYVSNPSATLNSFSNPNSKYTQLSFRLGLAVGVQFAVYWNANVGYEVRIFKDGDQTISNPLKFDGQWSIDEELKASFDAGWTVQSGIYSTIRFNNTDGGLWPNHGISTALFVNFVGIGGDIHFINLTYNFDAYWNPFWKVTLAFHYDMAFLFPQFGGTFSIRDANRLSFDGVYKMRGWLNYYVRGEASSFFSIETRIPIWSFIGTVLFWDYGAIFPSYTKFNWYQPSYIMSFGIGLAINLPILPIRLYAARPVEWKGGSFQLANDPSIGKGWEFVFSIQGLF